MRQRSRRRDNALSCVYMGVLVASALLGMLVFLLSSFPVDAAASRCCRGAPLFCSGPFALPRCLDCLCMCSRKGVRRLSVYV